MLRLFHEEPSQQHILCDSGLMLLWNKSSQNVSWLCWAGEQAQLADSNRHTMHLMPVSRGCAFLKARVKNPPANAGDTRDVGSIPEWGGSPGGGCGNPCQCSCLENPVDRGAWQATVHRVRGLDTTEAT